MVDYNPIIDYADNKFPKPQIMLSDTGILNAISIGHIKISPSFDANTETKRIQPASLDIKLQSVDEYQRIGSRELDFPEHNEIHTLRKESISSVNISELIDIGQLSAIRDSYLGISSELRSSLRWFGCFMGNSGSLFISGPKVNQVEVGNFSKNNIIFERDEKIAQVFILVDWQHAKMSRYLDMGVEVKTNDGLIWLAKKGYMVITPSPTFDDGKLVVHASNVAYKMNTLEEGIEFSKRKSEKYSPSKLLTRIDISSGYEIKPFEHVIIETVEKFNLTSNVGIRFWDNLVQMPSDEMSFLERLKYYSDLSKNQELISLTDGWIDPNYKGSFSRQPKWLTKRKIYPGMPIGLGQVFYYRNGTNRGYGDSTLGSQYQNSQSGIRK